jgi:hypothetical protein
LHYSYRAEISPLNIRQQSKGIPKGAAFWWVVKGEALKEKIFNKKCDEIN